MLRPDYQTELLKMIWPYQAGRRFVSDAGDDIEVRKPGDYDTQCDRFTGAEVVVNGVVFRGEVIFDELTQAVFTLDNCVLQVVPAADSTHILKDDGTFLPQVVLQPGVVTHEAYSMLRDGAPVRGCSEYILGMEAHERVAMFTRLLAERLRRKCSQLKAVYEECDQNWNETMYVQLFTWMGDRCNKQAFGELARRVRYTYVSRERNSLEFVEAMLLGTSGLLDLYDDDAYTRTLKMHYEYLRKKYSLTAMPAGQWTLAGNNPNNHPALRIAQLAGFLTTREFLFENMIKCRTVEDIHVLFRAEASEYWSTHYIPSRPSDYRRKRVGHFKANMLGINLVVPMMFSYGDYMNDTSLKENALDLLEKLACEQGIAKVDMWRQKGVPMESAFDSQAILELTNEFCEQGRCRHCMIGRRVVREVYVNEHAEEILK